MPSLINNVILVCWCCEALINSDLEVVNNQYYVKGMSKNGLKFEGWLNDKSEIYSTYITLNNWKHKIVYLGATRGRGY